MLSISILCNLQYQYSLEDIGGKGVGYYLAAMTNNRLMKVGNTSMPYIRLAKVDHWPFPRFVMATLTNVAQ